MRARPFLCVLVAALVASRPDIGVEPLGAQEPQQPTFRTEANYIRVDVYPTSNGVPVTDLRKEDFELFDEGAPQAIDGFELVRVPGLVPQDLRREPTTVAESRALLENPRARVFVVFLDYYHVDVAGSARMRDTLVDALDRFLGPDDLFAVMTPEMSALDLSFARKTTTVRGMLEKYWTWGERDQLSAKDPQDQQYRQCYPAFKPKPGCLSDQGIAEEMIERRREMLTIDALQDLVRYLRGAREERKAVLVLSNGWRLFRPDQALTRAVGCQAPSGLPPVGIDPRTGRITTGNATGGPESTTQAACETDRMRLAQIDNDQELRDIRQEANRSNVAFYPVDPRGLVAFDEPIMKLSTGAVPPPPTPPSVDRQRLNARLESLRALAADTDGLAIIQTNDLDSGFKRIIADLSSYYLLGYYSDRRMDGRFHTLRVRVKRPGVQVRARRGYLAPSPAAVTAAANRASANAAPSSAVALETRAIESALAPLNSLARERPLRLHGVAGRRPGATAAVWAVGEVSAAPEWRGGADVDLRLVDKDGGTIATGRVEVPAGSRHFAAKLAPPAGLSPGDYTVTARARGRSVDPNPTTASLVVTVRDAGTVAALMTRRGPTTGNRDVPTADVRFRRTEQLRLEIPAADAAPRTARLLDRNGKPLPLIVTAGVRDDPDGSRWHTAHLVLAPLAPGDYVIELTGAGGAEHVLVGFRVIP